jgi:hypothetical protein
VSTGTRVVGGFANFGRCPVGLLKDPDVSDAEARIYAWLTTWDYRRTGRVFSKREEMADDIGWSVSKLDLALRTLERRGAIRRIRRGPGRSNDIELLAEAWNEPGGRLASSDDQESPNDASQESPDDATTTRENEQERTHEKDPPGHEDQASLLPADDPAVAPVEKPRKRNEIFDAFVKAGFPANTDGEKSVIAKAAGDLRKLSPRPTAEMVEARARVALAEWPTSTPMAVTKHWTMLGQRVAAASSSTDARDPIAEQDAAIRRRRQGEPS